MSHTNHTQYYELPQYVGSDIINPLVDTNGAYEAIDTAMHNIATEAAQSTSNITELQSKVGSGVFDTTAQNATDAVNEVVGELNTADTGIKARLTTAESDIDTLQSQMVTAQGNIVDLQNNKANASDVSALGTRVSTAEGKISTLETNVADNTSDISSMQTALRNKAYTHYNRVNTLASVVADGVKTYAELLSQLFTDLQTSITNLADDEFITGSIELVRNGEQNAIASTVLWNKNTSLSNIALTSHTTAANGIFTEVFLLAPTGIFRSFKVDVDGAHFYENSANAPTSGVSLAIKAVIYKANDPVLS